MIIQQFISRLKSNTISLPEFQRGYVWRQSAVTALMESLYRDYPIGIITVWDTQPDDGHQQQLIVDGQQRLSSIYACYTNAVPEMHIGARKQPPINLHFNVNTEEFKFATQRDLRREPMWISVTSILNGGQEEDLRWREQIQTSTNYDGQRQLIYERRVNSLRMIANRNIPIQEIDNNRSLDEVQQMFDRINRLGKKPTRGELEMARLCIIWHQAKPQIAAETAKWQETLLQKAVDQDTLIRSMTAVHTGRYSRAGLKPSNAEEMETAFNWVRKSNAVMFDSLSQRLCVHEPNAVPTVATFAIISKYLSRHSGQFPSQSDEARALAYHLTSTGLGVYHGSTDNQIDQDLIAVEKENGWEALLENAKSKVGNAQFDSTRFRINRSGQNRAYSIVHTLQKQPHVLDWLTRKRIRDYHPSDLEKHHIFPEHLLLAAQIPKPEIDDVANMALISGETNNTLGVRPPEDYLREIDYEDETMLDAHLIPRDPTLWKIENYRVFLETRRGNFAKAANTLVEFLRSGKLP